jgi:hypothetical protein
MESDEAATCKYCRRLSRWYTSVHLKTCCKHRQVQLQPGEAISLNTTPSGASSSDSAEVSMLAYPVSSFLQNAKPVRGTQVLPHTGN